MANTPDQNAAEHIGAQIDSLIRRLEEELALLIGAPARIADINAELAIIQTEKTRIDGRRPPRPPQSNGNPIANGNKP